MTADLLVPVRRRTALLDRPLAGRRPVNPLLAEPEESDRLARREAVLHLLEISRQRRRHRVG